MQLMSVSNSSFCRTKAESATGPLLSRKSRPFEQYMSRFDVAKSSVLAITR
jgi:hypothetical protein